MSDGARKPISEEDLSLVTSAIMELRQLGSPFRSFSPNQLKRLNMILITGLAYEANFGQLKSLEEPG